MEHIFALPGAAGLVVAGHGRRRRCHAAQAEGWRYFREFLRPAGRPARRLILTSPAFRAADGFLH